MFGRRNREARIETVDAAFDQAEADVIVFGKATAFQIIGAYRAGTIDRNGVDAWVELALEQTALQAIGVPKSMLRQILASLHRTIGAELSGAGIEILQLPA